MMRRRQLDPAADRWLDDHRPGGERIAPAAAIVAWLIEAAALTPPLVLDDVRWLRPLRVPDRGNEIALTVDDAGGARRVRLLAGRHRSDGRPFGEALIAEAIARPAEAAPAAPPPLGRTSSRVELAAAPFQGPVFAGLHPRASMDGRGLDARAVFSRERPGSLPALPGGDLDARHLDALFQAASRHRGGSGAPAAARSIWVGRALGIAETIRVRGADEDYTLWLGDRTERTRLRVEGYVMRPARFLGAVRAPDPA